MRGEEEGRVGKDQEGKKRREVKRRGGKGGEGKHRVGQRGGGTGKRRNVQ